MKRHLTALDPIKVARLVEGYGIDAATERFAPWSRRAIRRAAEIGRDLILERQPAESAGCRQPARGVGGIDPADIARIALAPSIDGGHVIDRSGRISPALPQSG